MNFKLVNRFQKQRNWYFQKNGVFKKMRRWNHLRFLGGREDQFEEFSLSSSEIFKYLPVPKINTKSCESQLRAISHTVCRTHFFPSDSLFLLYVSVHLNLLSRKFRLNDQMRSCVCVWHIKHGKEMLVKLCHVHRMCFRISFANGDEEESMGSFFIGYDTRVCVHLHW